MKNKDETIKLREKILQSNKSIDKDLVHRHEELENELNKIGIDTQPKFNISSPFDSKSKILYNR